MVNTKHNLVVLLEVIIININLKSAYQVAVVTVYRIRTSGIDITTLSTKTLK